MIASHRNSFLDLLKGIGVMGMIAYHALFDLILLGEKFHLTNNVILWALKFGAIPVASIFIFVAGVNSQKLGTEKLFVLKKSFYSLVLASIVISVVTYFTLGSAWIRFGIIHFLLLMVIINNFIFSNFKKRYLLLFLLGVILFSSQTEHLAIDGNSYLSHLFSYESDLKAVDHVPLIPWISVYIAGILSAPFFQDNSYVLSFGINSLGGRLCNLLGRNSLTIYMLHQPIIIMILYILGFLEFGINR